MGFKAASFTCLFFFFSLSLTCLKSCVGPRYSILAFLLWWWLICWNLIGLAGGRHFQVKIEIHKLTPIHEDEIKLPIIRIMKWQNKEIELHNNILSVVLVRSTIYKPPLPFCSYFILLQYYWRVPNSQG